jgi:AraC-like DNA-binding protein
MQRLIPALAALPRPVFRRSEDLEPGSFTRQHAHDWLQFSHATSGVLEVKTAQGNYFLPPARGILIPPGVAHAVANSQRARMRSLYIDPEAIAAPPRCRMLEMSPLVRELLLAFLELPERYDLDGPDGRLAVVLIERLVELPEVDFALPMPGDERLAAICAGLQGNLEDKRTMAELAREAGMTERTLARTFLRQTGISFGAWRGRLRLLMSLGALERGAGVTAAALESGYDSASAYIAAFKRLFGKTPGEFFARDAAREGRGAP